MPCFRVLILYRACQHAHSRSLSCSDNCEVENLCTDKKKIKNLLVVRSMWQCRDCLKASLDEEGALRVAEFKDYCSMIKEDESIKDSSVKESIIICIKERIEKEMEAHKHRGKAMLREADLRVEWALMYSELAFAVTRDKPWTERQEAWETMVRMLKVKPWDLIVVHDTVRTQDQIRQHQTLPECLQGAPSYVDCYKAAQAEKAKKSAQVSRKRKKAKIRALPPVPLFTDGVEKSKPDKAEPEPVGDEDLMEGVDGGGPSGMTRVGHTVE